MNKVFNGSMQKSSKKKRKVKKCIGSEYLLERQEK